ncbi:hypothetical protein [Leuconostoc pseudomesenteroides]|uniref:hypothetical protein n=1 Tax=Leuconostoc pseudomesenteroides TaxID=33968 RepID=UPI0016695138|nr:hypothetical protein [Leuconostoc pseudomesenteroides]MCT4387441.1 hypothetical protein [Leuconostoc pseudomesenteroides]
MEQIDLPCKWNLYEFTGLPDFFHWDRGAETNRIYSEREAQIEKKQNLYRRITILSLVLGIPLSFEIIGFPLLIVAFIFRKNGRLGNKLTDDLNEEQRQFRNAWYAHTDIFVEPLAKKFMNGQWKMYRSKRICLIYSSERVIYFDADEELLVVYNRENIKEVSRERLHTGAQTQGTANSVGGATAIGNTGVTVGGAQTATQTNTTDFYEWHFDILTDFFDYPKVSMVLSDSQSVEDFIGKAYAILKP